MGQLTMGDILRFVKQLKDEGDVISRDKQVAYLSW